MKTAFVFIFLLIAGSYSHILAQQWAPLGSGLSGPNFEESVVDKLAVIDGKLYATGYFNDAGGIQAWSIAYWTGSKWETHGIGVDSMVGVLDVVSFQDKIVAFFTWGGEELINYWSGSAWEKFESEGLGSANFYTDAEVHKGQLYLLQDAAGVFRFNGTSWDKLPGSDLLEMPRVLCSHNDDLYIGTPRGLYKYNGSQIELVWANANIHGLRVFDDMLYMTGGYLGVIGSDSMTGVAKFNGVTAISLGKPIAVDTTEFTEYIKDVAKIGDRLIAGGDVHTELFGQSKIMTYANGVWDDIGDADGLITSVASIGNTAYVGGYFYNILGQPFSNVAAVTFSDDNFILSGQVFFDLDNNCMKDPIDITLREHVVRVLPGPHYTSTDADGRYSLSLDSGSYTVTAAPLSYGQGCDPGTYTVQASSTGLDFAFRAIDDTVRVQPYLFAGRYVAGRKNMMMIQVVNVGGVPATNVSVQLNLSNYLTFFTSSHPYQQTGPGQYLFMIDSIPIQDYRLISIIDSVDVNALREFARSRVFAFVGSGPSLQDEFDQEIVGPFDPNEKLVASQLEGGPFVMQDTILADNMLTYKVNFQNVGSDTAYKVVIRDTIAEFLDLSTFHTLSSSHPYTVELNGSNMITWTFDNINLPDSGADFAGSNGGVRYRIDQKSGNSPGTVITNTAAIYFDFNAPVITNQTVNVIALPSSVARSASGQVLRITPNPAGNTVSIGLSTPTSEVARIAIYSILGKEVYSAQATLPAFLAIEMVPRGMYRVLVSLRSGETISGNLILD